ncbi:DUF2516 family protein [Nocardioides sp. BP30]|uniref:DUF2516 family protein n=1 Tax=Nocardioides sp. BP30 TaxID=3036374 RepID=UPI00246995C7|nr:DUF2516 family protein [Nocardioides sp. BP30]WGL53071.1 DUF2516 family protein [Nocardioides sp. BP30]
MEGIFEVQSNIMLLVRLAVLAVVIFAFISSLTYSAEAYRAAGKWSKQGWTIVLGIALVLQFVPIGIMLIQLGLLIAALVFLADVRPALSSLRRR